MIHWWVRLFAGMALSIFPSQCIWALADDVAEDVPCYENFLRYSPKDPRAAQTYDAVVELATAPPRGPLYAEFADFVDIDGAAFDEETGDLVLWGPRIAESDVGYMPPLLLDDLVLALQVLNAKEDLGVSIGTYGRRVPTEAELQESARTKTVPVEYIPDFIAGTHAGFVLFEADRWLKTMALGVDSLTYQKLHCPVPGYRPMTNRVRMDFSQHEGEPVPFGLNWFVPDPTGCAFEGYAIKFVDYKMLVKYRALVNDPSIKQFADQMTEDFDQYVRQYVVFRELVRLHKLVQVARWCVECGFPQNELLEMYHPLPIHTYETTKTVQSRIRNTNGYLIGGVDFSPPNHYIPANAVPSVNLRPGTPPNWRQTPSTPRATPPKYGSLSGQASIPNYVAPLIEARPTTTSTSWVVSTENHTLKVVAIPMGTKAVASFSPANLSAVSMASDETLRAKQVYPSSTKEALQRALTLMKDQQAESDIFLESLQSTAKELPELTLTTPRDSVPWRKIALNLSGTGMDAIRFTSPLDEPGDLRWAFALPANSPLGNWYILPSTGKMTGFKDFKRETNLHLPGVDLTEENVVIFQGLDGGRILPGEEYILWFAGESDKPVEIYVALALAPAGTTPGLDTAEDFAALLGIPLPLRSTPVPGPSPEGGATSPRAGEEAVPPEAPMAPAPFGADEGVPFAPSARAE